MLKKIFFVFITIILSFVLFTLNVFADIIDYNFTHAYYNPLRNLISINASTLMFNNSKYDSSDFTFQNTIRFMVGKMNYTSATDNFMSYLFNFDYYEIKEYNGYIYIYIPSINYERASSSHKISTDVYSTTVQSYGFSSIGYKTLIKFKRDFSFLKIASFNTFSNTISIDDFIQDDLSGLISYYETLTLYDTFFEYQSTFNILGETYKTNGDIENPTYQGTLLSDKQAFINWIISQQKYTVFGDYGLENTVEVVDDIVNLYEQFNKNPLSLFVNVPLFLIQNGSIFSTVDKAKELINYVSALYQEFKLERRPQIYIPEQQQYLFPQPYIDYTVTDKYIDNETDTIDISLLREILRTLIIMPQNIFNFFDYYMYNISVNTSLLADYVSQLPQYLSDLIYNNFVIDINYIKNALDNMSNFGGSDLINVEITTEKETEINTFFNDWNIQFSNKINEKIPIIPQLHTLFSTFWEQTNVVSEEELSLYNYNEFTSNSDALTAITGVFDDSNKDYLTNIQSPFIPSLTIKIGGVSREIINFKLYAKYRFWIHNLISFVLWFAFLLSLYKSLPQIIGRVAGLEKFMDTKNEGVKDDSIVDSYYISDRKD